jgi:hypothetical protein
MIPKKQMACLMVRADHFAPSGGPAYKVMISA